jgi:uncharacterized protein (TIGR02246 family)
MTRDMPTALTRAMPGPPEAPRTAGEPPPAMPASAGGSAAADFPRAKPGSAGPGRRVIAVLFLLAALATAAALAGLPDGAGGGSDDPTRPLSEDDVRDVADRFAEAYQSEDTRALAKLVTRDVQRVLPGGVARGREQIVDEYARQFRANATESYDLEDLEVTAGRAGRASGAYKVTREGGEAIEGTIVLGVVRDRLGRARIGLIAVTPSA